MFNQKISDYKQDWTIFNSTKIKHNNGNFLHFSRFLTLINDKSFLERKLKNWIETETSTYFQSPTSWRNWKLLLETMYFCVSNKTKSAVHCFLVSKVKTQNTKFLKPKQRNPKINITADPRGRRLFLNRRVFLPSQNKNTKNVPFRHKRKKNKWHDTFFHFIALCNWTDSKKLSQGWRYSLAHVVYVKIVDGRFGITRQVQERLTVPQSHVQVVQSEHHAVHVERLLLRTLLHQLRQDRQQVERRRQRALDLILQTAKTKKKLKFISS